MIGAGLACLVHGLLPFLCVKTGSNAIRALHHDMVTHRQRKATGPGRGRGLSGRRDLTQALSAPLHIVTSLS
jgi:hypothetical protein